MSEDVTHLRQIVDYMVTNYPQEGGVYQLSTCTLEIGVTESYASEEYSRFRVHFVAPSLLLDTIAEILKDMNYPSVERPIPSLLICQFDALTR